MDNFTLVIYSLFLATNLIAFVIMLIDKIRSIKHKSERISEGMLFFLATIFGAIGIYLGMFVFRHKTKKWYFLVGIPLLIVQNVAAAYLFYIFLNN